MSKKYDKFRRIRKDGNCFYRALSFAFFENLIKNPNEKLLKEFIKEMKDTKQFISAGFDPFIFEDFQEVILKVLEQIEKKSLKIVDLENIFLDPNQSEYIVVYMRLIVSAYIQAKKDDFLPFLYEFNSVEDFCRKEVEPMGKEADNLHISAITARLPQLCVCIELIDHKNINTMIFPENGKPNVILLFLPGHYDILYPKN